MDKKQKELDDFKTIISDAGYEHSKKYFAPGSLFDVKLDVKTQQIAEESFAAGAIFMHEILRKKDSSVIVIDKYISKLHQIRGLVEKI